MNDDWKIRELRRIHREFIVGSVFALTMGVAVMVLALIAMLSAHW